LLALWAALGLAGCASTPAPPPVTVADFDVSGKFSIRGGGQPVSARFRWLQRGAGYDLELWGPFGQGRRRLTGDDQQLTLLDGRGAVLASGPVEAVMAQQLGWSFPIGMLSYWVRGQIAPGSRSAIIEQDPDGLLRRFEQAGWTLSYPRYRFEDSGGTPLPGLIDARDGRFELRIALTRWGV
jgi:outer membrane lipoprotein LolB